MKKLVILYFCITIVFYLSCNRVFDPENSIGPNGIYFSLDKNIYKMNYDGSNKIQITFDKGDNNNPRISNDGRLLIYETQTRTNPLSSLFYDNSVINIMNLETQNMIKIAYEKDLCTNPSFSPDNQFVVFCSELIGQGRSIVFSDINGKEYKRLTEYGTNRNPTFTPQGDKIIYISDHDQKTNIFMMSLDGTNKQQLTDSEHNVDPVFSPDGTKILWAGYSDIYSMNLDSSNKINLSENSYVHSRCPSYSNKGDKIVFITGMANKRTNEIHLIDLNTKNRNVLLRTGENFIPIFFPGDDKIIFTQYENYQFYICTIKIDGSGFHKLCKGGNPYIF
jgi:Tol biopolymer transport system component